MLIEDRSSTCRMSPDGFSVYFILFDLPGHGYVDMYACNQYFSGEMSNYHVSDEDLAKYIKSADTLNRQDDNDNETFTLDVCFLGQDHSYMLIQPDYNSVLGAATSILE